MKKLVYLFSLVALLASCGNSSKIADSVTTETDTLRYPEETHLKNIQQLTFGGDNAEAYWSYDGKSERRN